MRKYFYFAALMTVLSAHSPALARFITPQKLNYESGKASLTLQENPSINVPKSVDYVYTGTVRYPGSASTVKREIWLRGGANYQMTGFLKESGKGLSCYGFATYSIKGEALVLDYFQEEDGNQNCPMAGGSFVIKVIPQY